MRKHARYSLMACLVLLTFLSSFSVSAVDVDYSMIENHLRRQLELQPQEKLYIHLDRTTYSSCDRVWYTVHSVDALTHEPHDANQYVYVELVDQNEVVLKRNKNINDGGCAWGYFDLPHDMAEGILFVRAYVRDMVANTGFASVAPVLVNMQLSSEMKSTTQSLEHFAWHDANEQLEVKMEDSNVRLGLLASSPPMARLLLLNRFVPCFTQELRRGSSVVLSLDSLPSGIVNVLLLDNEGRLLAQYNFANRGGDIGERCIPMYRILNGDSTQVELSFPQLMDGETANVSVSVGRCGDLTFVPPIDFSLDVSSELKHGTGWIMDYDETTPLYSLASIVKNEELRYDLDSVLCGNYIVSKAHPETTACVSGSVHTLLLGRGVSQATVSALSLKAGDGAVTVSGTDGNFTLCGLEAPEGSEFVVRAVDKNKKDNVALKLFEEVFPDIDRSLIQAQLFPLKPVEDPDTVFNPNDGSILLDNVEVRGFRFSSTAGGNKFSSMADFSMGYDVIREVDATCLHDLLRRVPGVYMREERCYIRAHSSIYGDNPAAIAVDGVIMDDDFDLHLIHMQDVEGVDVFKTGTTAIWGHRGGNGVVSIRLKEGGRVAPPAPTPNVKRIKPLGYQIPVAFEANSHTLYWAPRVKIQGESHGYTFKCLLPEVEDDWMLRVEGVTSHGHTIHLFERLSQ